jgi:hypothetical protein
VVGLYDRLPDPGVRLRRLLDGGWMPPVAEELDALAARLRKVVAALEPDALSPEVALRVLRAFVGLAKHAAAGEALVAGRVEACGAHAEAGFASTDQLMASLAGTSAGRAARVVETGRRLAAHDATAAAVRAGRISIDQAHAVTAAAEADPQAEASLLAFAEHESLRRLETKAREVRLATDDDRLGRDQRHRAARGLRHGIDDDGMGWGHWRLPPDDHVAVVNRLERQADREFRAAHREGRREPHDRYLADAVVSLCTRREGTDAASRDTRAEVVFHVDAQAITGEVGPDGLCMVRGGGPVPVERVREAVALGAFVKAVVHEGTEIRAVKHFGRRRPAVLQTALEARAVRRDGDVYCDEDGCDRTLGLEWDHDQPVAAHGPTSYDNLKPRCRPHHRDKTERDRRRSRSPTGPDP